MSTESKNIDIGPRDGWNPRRPYNELPGLPGAGELETRLVLKECIAARSALAELKQAVALIPNPRMLINTLPLLEAQASSEIEDVVTTADELLRHLPDVETAEPATKEALRYREALLEAWRGMERRPLGTRTAETICSRITGVEMAVRTVPGATLAPRGKRRVVYTPPEGEGLLRELLADWERFLHGDDDLDPLVRMAAAHYQFEAIHPFLDGNGRTGRVLNSLVLVDRGLLPLPVLYLSRYIIANRSDYYRSLRAVTSDGAWEEWILFMLRGVAETAGWTTTKIAAIRGLAAAAGEFVQRRLPKIYRHELVMTIFEQPYCRIAHLVEAGIAKRQTASVYLKALVNVGVLREHAAGRDKRFENKKLMSLLTRDTNRFTPYR